MVGAPCSGEMVFADPVPDSVVCPKCHKNPKIGTKFSPCGHQVCGSCDKGKDCPVCGETITLRSLDAGLSSKIQAFESKARIGCTGCKFVGTRATFWGHTPRVEASATALAAALPSASAADGGSAGEPTKTSTTSAGTGQFHVQAAPFVPESVRNEASASRRGRGRRGDRGGNNMNHAGDFAAHMGMQPFPMPFPPGAAPAGPQMFMGPNGQMFMMSHPAGGPGAVDMASMAAMAAAGQAGMVPPMMMAGPTMAVSPQQQQAAAHSSQFFMGTNGQMYQIATPNQPHSNQQLFRGPNGQLFMMQPPGVTGNGAPSRASVPAPKVVSPAAKVPPTSVSTPPAASEGKEKVAVTGDTPLAVATATTAALPSASDAPKPHEAPVVANQTLSSQKDPLEGAVTGAGASVPALSDDAALLFFSKGPEPSMDQVGTPPISSPIIQPAAGVDTLLLDDAPWESDLRAEPSTKAKEDVVAAATEEQPSSKPEPTVAAFPPQSLFGGTCTAMNATTNSGPATASASLSPTTSKAPALLPGAFLQTIDPTPAPSTSALNLNTLNAIWADTPAPSTMDKTKEYSPASASAASPPSNGQRSWAQIATTGPNGKPKDSLDNDEDAVSISGTKYPISALQQTRGLQEALGNPHMNDRRICSHGQQCPEGPACGHIHVVSLRITATMQLPAWMLVPGRALRGMLALQEAAAGLKQGTDLPAPVFCTEAPRGHAVAERDSTCQHLHHRYFRVRGSAELVPAYTLVYNNAVFKALRGEEVEWCTGHQDPITDETCSKLHARRLMVKMKNYSARLYLPSVGLRNALADQTVLRRVCGGHPSWATGDAYSNCDMLHPKRVMVQGNERDATGLVEEASLFRHLDLPRDMQRHSVLCTGAHAPDAPCEGLHLRQGPMAARSGRNL